MLPHSTFPTLSLNFTHPQRTATADADTAADADADTDAGADAGAAAATLQLHCSSMGLTALPKGPQGAWKQQRQSVFSLLSISALRRKHHRGLF